MVGTIHWLVSSGTSSAAVRFILLYRTDTVCVFSVMMYNMCCRCFVCCGGGCGVVCTTIMVGNIRTGSSSVMNAPSCPSGARFVLYYYSDMSLDTSIRNVLLNISIKSSL